MKARSFHFLLSTGNSDTGTEHYFALHQRSRHCGIYFEMHRDGYEHFVSGICERVRYSFQARALGVNSPMSYS